MKFDTRLSRLEHKTKEGFSEILILIRKGSYYDEITEEQKKAYCSYRDIDKNAMENIESYINGSLHFRLEKNVKPPTDYEHAKAVEEVEQYVAKCIKEYNSPAAAEQRKTEYEELQRIGKLRRQAFLNGQDMDEMFPLPF